MLVGLGALALIVRHETEQPALSGPAEAVDDPAATPKPTPASRSLQRVLLSPSEQPSRPNTAATSSAAPNLGPPRVKAAMPTAVTRAVEKAGETGQREVQVFVAGALGGSLRIDGSPTEWFGKTHKLGYGEHRFDFVPPDPVCCRGSERIVLIEAGEGKQIVRGQITFRDATLQVSSLVDAKAKLSCPTVFTERMTIPGERSIPMAQAELEVRCTITPDEALAAPVQRVVTLRAGRTAVLSWP